MTDIAKLRDKDGVIHYTASDSQFARDGLADGSLVDAEEVADAPTDAEDRDGDDTGSGDGEPVDGPGGDGRPDNGDSEGVAEPKARR